MNDEVFGNLTKNNKKKKKKKQKHSKKVWKRTCGEDEHARAAGRVGRSFVLEAGRLPPLGAESIPTLLKASLWGGVQQLVSLAH